MSTLEFPVPYTSRRLRARRLGLRGAARLGGWTLMAAIVVVWALLFRPQFLGGPAAYVMVSGMSMEPTLHNGDLVVAHRRDHFRVGDTVVYRVPKGEAGAGSMIIHRIVGGSAAKGWIVQGDNRDVPDLWRPKAGNIVGSTWLHVPGAGTILAYAMSPFALATISTFLAFFIGLPSAAVEALDSRPRRRVWRPQKIAAAAAAAMASVGPFLRTDAVVVVFPKPRLPVPVSVPFAPISAVISERVRLALPALRPRRSDAEAVRTSLAGWLDASARSWGEAAWTARDLFGR
jgi:signal peptidase